MKYFLLPILLLFFGSATLAQTNIISSGTDSLMFKNQGIKSMVIAPDGTVRIGTVKAMDNSALLQINSNTKGLLIPSLTTAQRDAIAGPANGLLIYNVTTSEFNYYNGSAWSLLYPSNSVWRLTGNAGTVDGTNFIGTTDNVPLSFRVNNALAGKVTSDGNSFFGYQSGNANVGYYNTGVGLNALNLNTTGNDNTAVGVYSLSFNSTGTDNAAIGFGSLASNVSGNANTASGSYSLYSNVAGSGATAIGKGAMYYANNAVSPFTNYNVALGFEALRGSTDASANTGNNNTALGYQTLRSNTTGDNNTASGLSSLSSNTMGQYNTASGVQSLYNNTTGSNNTASGSYSLFGNTTGSNNNALGYLADVGSNNLTNATAIGAMAYVTTNNSMVLGSINGVNGAIANTNVGIGTTAPSQALSVAEKFQVNASGNIIKLNNVTTSFPAAQGGANTVLTNNGSGGLTWASVTGTLSGGSNNYLTKWSGANTATTSVLYDNGTNVGLGTASPTSLFSVGASSQFQVNSSGNIVKINNLTTSFPAAQGGANTVLTNNGSGGLTWASVAGTLSGGSNNYLTKWSGANTATTSVLYDNGTNVGLGTASPVSTLDVTFNAASAGGIAISSFGTPFTPVMQFNQARGTLSTPTATLNGDQIGQLQFNGYSTSRNTGASINAMATQAWSGSAQGTKLTFVTTSNSTTTPQERMVIDQSGYVGISATAPTQALSVAEKFQVDANGNIVKINNVPTSFPAAQGGANTVLTNNGSGGLTWASVTGTLSGGSNNYLTKWSGANTATTSVLYDNGTNVGLGTTSPTSLFSVGASSQFQINASGNIVKINNLTASFPATQGSANTVLTNNGSGGLTWASVAGTLSGGTANYVPKWSGSNTLASTSLLYDNGTTVGINTSTPSAGSKLHIVGSGNGSTLNVEDNSVTNGSLLYLSSTSTVGTANNVSSMISIQRSGSNTNTNHTAYGISSSITNTGTSSTNIAGYFSATGATNNYAALFSAGNVGIGTATPTQLLSVAEKFQVDANGNIVKLNNVTTSFPAAQGGANTVLTNNGSGTLTWGTVAGTLSGGTANYLTKWSGANTATTSLLYDNGTTVGINTVSPPSAYALSVHKTGTSSAYLAVTSPGTGTSQETALHLTTLNTATGSTALGNTGTKGWSIGGRSNAWATTGEQNDFYISSYNGSAWNQMLNIDMLTGNVGIGTTTPGYPLEVAKNVSGTYTARVVNSGGTTTSHGMQIQAGAATAGANMIAFYRSDATLIGSISQNAATSVAYNTTSDKRLKNVLGKTNYGLSDLLKLNVYDYYYKADSSKKRLTGLLAQELYTVYPVAVTKPKDESKSAKEDPWLVDYSSLTPLLIKSMQEQQQLIEDLKAENSLLKKDLLKTQEESLDNYKKLKAELDTVKQYLNLSTNKAPIK